MGNQVNIAFQVRLKSEARNVIASAVIIAETDVDAIETLKAQTLSSLTEYINDRRDLFKTDSYVPPDDFWKDVEAKAVALKPKVMNFMFDRLSDKSPFILR